MKSEFQEGVSVAIISGYADHKLNARVAAVEKVMKNGNFTVSGLGSQQHKPQGRVAYPTGQEDRYRYTHTIELLDATFLRAQEADRRNKEREERWAIVLKRLKKVKSSRLVPWQVLEALEFALDLMEGEGNGNATASPSGGKDQEKGEED